MLENQAGLNSLPIEILFEIYSYLSPEQTDMLAAVNKVSNAIIRDNVFWKKKYKRHFPHLYDALISQEKVNWYDEFRNTYADEYKDLSDEDRRLFSLAKEGDIESLRAKKIALDSFDRRDKNGMSLLNWAQQAGSQQVLNYFYKIAQKSYKSEIEYLIDVEKADEYGRTILYWALNCYQAYEQIHLLLQQGSKLGETYFLIGKQPIHIAAQEGRLDVVQAFIENKPELLEQVDAYDQTPLFLAAREGRAKVVDYLISKGANLDVSSNRPGDKDHGKTPLYWAAERGDIGIVLSLVKAGATATTALDDTRIQPIHIAAMKGHLEVVRVLIENKPELLNQVDASDQTPLLWAASRGHLAIVEYLLEQRGVNLNDASQGFSDVRLNGRTALHWAAVHGYSEVVAALVKAGATATLTSGTMQTQPIHVAAQKGHLDVVQAFIENKPGLLEQVDACGQTPLLLAAAEGRAEVVDYLISKGANLNVSSNRPGDEDHGKTPLHWAALHGHSKVAAALVRAGATATLTFGQLMHLAAQEGYLEVVQALIEINPELLNQVDALGQTPLIWAASKGHSEIVKYLLEQPGVSLDASSQGYDDVSVNGRTALHWAALHGHSKVVEALVRAGATATLTFGQLMHLAAQEGYLEVVRALIEINPELLNQVDARGQTPLIRAASKGHLSIVEYLLEQRGVNLNAASKGFDDDSVNGRTALHWAALYGHSEVVEALVRAGATATLTAGTMQTQPIHIAAEKGHYEVVRALIEINPGLLNQVDLCGQTPLIWAASKGHLKIVKYLLEKRGVYLNYASQGCIDDSMNGRTAFHWAALKGHFEVAHTLLKHATPTLAKTFKSSLNENVKAKLGLLEYIHKRSSQPIYKKSFTFFCHTFNFGFSREEKINAANALKEVVINGADISTLDRYKKELNNGDLGSIYRSLRVR